MQLTRISVVRGSEPFLDEPLDTVKGLFEDLLLRKEDYPEMSGTVFLPESRTENGEYLLLLEKI